MLNESLYELRVAFLVLGVLGLLNLKSQKLVLLFDCLSVVHTISNLCRHFKVLRC